MDSISYKPLEKRIELFIEPGDMVSVDAHLGHDKLDYSSKGTAFNEQNSKLRK
ncbi:hypothetical protein [Flammeovirga aprica]|uniref:Uncharacterized protein n=1 Tax=Flammeovirga aprica JL-4 TaxID=694437 RepID=A0A7X9X9U0_9BACT|nr:hypothetical protein [Flammeovirga aprica]NME69043.1 hypothetical protein [Flammeovirga aprica JL-4]